MLKIFTFLEFEKKIASVVDHRLFGFANSLSGVPICAALDYI